MSREPAPQPLLPKEPIDRLVAPLQRFVQVEAASGIVLLACTAIALGLTNSSAAARYLAFWETPVTLGFGPLELSLSLRHWINDALMAVFFFVVGLEVKRELVVGELRDPRRAALPIVAALGGMIGPAAIYFALQRGQPAQSGWGIPMATDIAFVVGSLALIGSRVPPGLRVMLLSLAIADDIGAILVIAIGYTAQIHWTALALGVLGLALVYAMRRLGVRSILVYTLVGALVWLAFHESGVHATIAGVALGLMTPAERYLGDAALPGIAARAVERLASEPPTSPHDRVARVRRFRRAARESLSPLEYLEALIHPWVGFAIMPLFALANAGVAIEVSEFGSPVAHAVGAGLVLGKPIGILFASAIATTTGIARLPDGVGWRAMLGAGCLAGIGFTMALFIAALALDPSMLDEAKVGVLAGSAVSGFLGLVMLATLPKRERVAD